MGGFTSGTLFGVLIFLLLFGSGTFMVIRGLGNRKKGAASTTWPTANGVITHAWVERETSEDEDGFTSTSYTPKWQYQFKLGGNTYNSEKISYSATTGYGRQAKAQEKLNQFPLNNQVKVYYDPNEPTESVLIPGTKGTMSGIIIGVILAIGSVAWVYFQYLR